MNDSSICNHKTKRFDCQRLEESDERDRLMVFLFIVVITIKYLQLIDMGGLRTTGHREGYTVMEAGVNYLQHQYVKTRGIKYM